MLVLLIVGIPGHEFPQPFDHVIRCDDVISSSVRGANNSDVVFFRDSTLLLVGPIPVQFGEYVRTLLTIPSEMLRALCGATFLL